LRAEIEWLAVRPDERHRAREADDLLTGVAEVNAMFIEELSGAAAAVIEGFAVRVLDEAAVLRSEVGPGARDAPVSGGLVNEDPFLVEADDLASPVGVEDDDVFFVVILDVTHDRFRAILVGHDGPPLSDWIGRVVALGFDEDVPEEYAGGGSGGDRYEHGEYEWHRPVRNTETNGGEVEYKEEPHPVHRDADSEAEVEVGGMVDPPEQLLQDGDVLGSCDDADRVREREDDAGVKQYAE